MKRVDFILEKKLRASFKNDGYYHYQFLKEKMFFRLPQGIVPPHCECPEISVEAIVDMMPSKYKAMDKLKDDFCEHLSDSCPAYGSYFAVTRGWELIPYGKATEVMMWMRGYWLTNVEYNAYNEPDNYFGSHHTPQLFSDFMWSYAKKQMAR